MRKLKLAIVKKMQQSVIFVDMEKVAGKIAIKTCFFFVLFLLLGCAINMVYLSYIQLSVKSIDSQLFKGMYATSCMNFNGKSSHKNTYSYIAYFLLHFSLTFEYDTHGNV